jgi:hypothetical protein
MKKFILFLGFLLVHQAFGVKIVCFYDLELFFDEMKVAYTCTVVHLVTNETNREVTEVVAQNPEQHLGDDEVRQLYIIHQKMHYFPRGFTKYFMNLEALHAGMNELKFLEQDDMREFEKLRFLYLYSNHLENLQSDVLAYNSELEYVSFNNNRLVHISSKLLAPLKKLRTAYFNKNICIDKQAVHNSAAIAELKLEISERCSDITDEDLMMILKQNQEKIYAMEMQLVTLNDRISELIHHLNVSNKTEL